MKRYLLIALVVFSAYLFWQGREVSRPAGVLAPDEPKQEALPNSFALDRNGYRITPLASFDITARVISSRKYRYDRQSDLAPVDLVLGWGPMSDSRVLKQISFTQNTRAYSWWTNSFPIAQEVIETHSANMHMIPTNPEIEGKLRSIRPGNIVHLEGYLVEVNSKDGWRWRSSLTRTDTGPGACELIWVESLDVS
jgi:hypothetical protein